MASTLAHIDPDHAAALVRKYNEGTYRGVSNLELDKRGYRLLGDGLGRTEADLREQLLFVGRDYGGVMAFAVPDGIDAEALRIARALLVDRGELEELIQAQSPLVERTPAAADIRRVLAPFQQSKFWLVWASKVLHFRRPDVFPIYDSRVERVLGISPSAAHGDRLVGLCEKLSALLARQPKWLIAAERADGGTSPSRVKLVDKFLFEAGAPAGLRAAPAEKRTRPTQGPSRPGILKGPAPEGDMVCSIANIAAKADQAAGKDRLELRVPKEYWHRFPDDAQWTKLVIDGVHWKVRIGKKERVAFLYFRTEFVREDQMRDKITPVLRRAGLGVGDRPILSSLERGAFRLITG